MALLVESQEEVPRPRRSGGWREAFLHRQRRGVDTEEPAADSTRRGAIARSVSRRSSDRTARQREATEGFDQKAVLEQDRALIEQLTQRQPRERSEVRKPPPPPKVAPYRPCTSSTVASDPSGLSLTPTLPPSPGPDASRLEDRPDSCYPWSSPPRTAPGCELGEDEFLSASDARVAAASTDARCSSCDEGPCSFLEPIVPRVGPHFTSHDINSLFDGFAAASLVPKEEEGLSSSIKAVAESEPEIADCGPNFADISEDFFKSNRMKVAKQVEVPKQDPVEADCLTNVPQRRALREQIQAIDSWLEEDMAARSQLAGRGTEAFNSRPQILSSVAQSILGNSFEDQPQLAKGSNLPSEASLIRMLEDAKQRKVVGESVSSAALREVATQVKPMLPSMRLEKLIQLLRLFAAVRHEDHDLYLRILGEIPVQVRGISPDLLVTAIRVLWRLRLCEETYLELLSMEAMNMIRAARRPAARAPRRPAAPSRTVDVATTSAATSGSLPVPTPPSPEVPAPFTTEQLIHIGNALCQLGAKLPARFMETYQEQLTVAIPRMTQEECEMVSPSLATSQLLHDPLRRAFLERAAQVDAGLLASATSGDRAALAPNIPEYHREQEERRRRAKYLRNIFVIEASVRKETFSFFTSLSGEVRNYLERLHVSSENLPHEGSNALALQVASILDQLGVSCDMKCRVGPLSLHIVTKALNPKVDIAEIVYECSDASSYYSPRQDDRGAPPQLTAAAKMRHRLLQRLGVQLVHISIWDWQKLSEAQRVNFVVKLQSLQ